MHPFSGADHLLAMITVGLWGAFLGRPLIHILPVIFPAMTTGLLHISGIALGALNARPIGILTTRSFGGLIAIGGTWFLFRAIGT